MLSRWFKTKSPEKVSEKPAAKKPGEALIAPAQPKIPKPREPGLLEQLAGGQAIESLTDMDVLHQLLKNSDKLDKRTNRSVRERINALRDADKTRLQQRDQQEKTCARLETMARLQYHPLFDSELAHLQQLWNNVGHQDLDIKARIDTAMQQCLRIQLEAVTVRQQEEQAARIAEQLRLEQAEQAQRLAEQQEANLAAQTEQQAAQAQTLAAEKQARLQSSAEQQKARAQAAKTAEQQLTQLEEAIAQSNSKNARQVLDRLRESLKKLDPAQAQRYEGKLHLLQGQMRDLQDWQDYAALPKLEELCAAMEKLVDVQLPAPQKAESVRELQTQWRAMKAPSSKNAQVLWDRFKKASDIAWEPCAIHFEKEKQLRSFNVQQRNVICEALEQFASLQDWEKADWKAVARILEKAKKEFHDFFPVERHDEKPSRQRFDAAMDAIQQKLLAEQLMNEEKKRQLVETALSLDTMTDIDKAIERSRQLQDQWKTIGLTRRHEDQKLWQRFQEHCNNLFLKRKASHQQQWQAQNAQMDRAKSLCDAIQALAKLPDPALSSSQSEFDDLQTQFKAITDIPEKSQVWLKKLFYEACDQYRTQCAGIVKRQRGQQWQSLEQQAALCARLEQQPSPENVAALSADWQPHTLQADWQAPLQARWDTAVAVAEGKIADTELASLWLNNEKQRRQLCVALEILLDVETPEEDRQQRRDYQMQRLTKGIGQGTENRSDSREQLVAQWHCCGPAAPQIQAVLDARFRHLPVR